jgi:hypothetical protein
MPYHFRKALVVGTIGVFLGLTAACVNAGYIQSQKCSKLERIASTHFLPNGIPYAETLNGNRINMQDYENHVLSWRLPTYAELSGQVDIYHLGIKSKIYDFGSCP